MLVIFINYTGNLLELRQACFAYFKFGGRAVTDPVGLLSVWATIYMYIYYPSQSLHLSSLLLKWGCIKGHFVKNLPISNINGT